MKITKIEAIPVNVPMKQGLTMKTSHGEHITSPYVIIKIHTNSEHTGLGEATVTSVWSGETSPGCVANILGLIAPAFLGKDPREVNKLRRIMDGLLRLNPATKAGIEMALWDIAGKAAGVPVYQLLGGKVRDELPIRMVIGSFVPAKAVELAKQFLASGAKCLKVKVGRNPDEDYLRVKAVREVAGPEIPIGIDANCGWTVPQACQMLDRLAKFDLLFAEQPISTANPLEMSALRSRTTIPIMADESIFSIADAWQLVKNQAADVYSVYPGKNGGILATIEISHVIKAAGLVCSMGSNLELGIGTAAMLHVGAAISTIDSETYPGDFLGPLYHEADLIETPLTLGPQAALIPDGPGLGVQLDEQQIEKYRDESGLAKSIGEISDNTFEQ